MDFEDSYPSLVWERPFWSPQYYDSAPRYRPPSYCDHSIMTLLYYDHPVIMTTPLLRPPCYFTPPPPTPSVITSPILSPPPTLWPPRLYPFFQLQTKVHKFFVFHNNTLFIHAPFTSPLLPLTLWSLQFFPSRSYLTSITVISVPAQRRRRQRRSLLSHLF